MLGVTQIDAVALKTVLLAEDQSEWRCVSLISPPTRPHRTPRTPSAANTSLSSSTVPKLAARSSPGQVRIHHGYYYLRLCTASITHTHTHTHTHQHSLPTVWISVSGHFGNKVNQKWGLPHFVPPTLVQNQKLIIFIEITCHEKQRGGCGAVISGVSSTSCTSSASSTLTSHPLILESGVSAACCPTVTITHWWSRNKLL